MTTQAARDLSAASRLSLVGPAGYGKTETIAQAVGLVGSGRQLVLTHTNAGVAALRARLAGLGSPADAADVATLASWSYGIAAAYPRTSGLQAAASHDDCYAATRRLVQAGFFRRVLRASYVGLYVDEYQDCSKEQHSLVEALADVLPCRVVGDPLQAIFGFAQPCVDWTSDVVPAFAPRAPLDVPWRWKGNRELGEWVGSMRRELESGGGIELASPVTRIAPDDTSGLYSYLRRLRNVLVLGDGTGAYKNLGRRLARLGFRVVEPVDSPDLRRWANRLDEAEDAELALAILKCAADCASGVAKTRYSTIYKVFEEGKGKPRKDKELYGILREAAGTGSVRAVREALGRLLDAGNVFRGGVAYPLLRALREISRLGEGALPASIARYVERNRYAPRRLPGRAVASTLLAKGLEAEHVVIFNAERLDRNNLYVALTRASESVAVVSNARRIRPWHGEERDGG